MVDLPCTCIQGLYINYFHLRKIYPFLEDIEVYKSSTKPHQEQAAMLLAFMTF